MKTPSRSRDRKKYCRFHRDHDHDTEQCIQLRDEIEVLFRWGYLKKFWRDHPTQPPTNQQPQLQAEKTINNRSMVRVINMIFEWPKNWEEESVKKRWFDNVIIFLEDDVRRIQTLHDDAVVVSTMIVNYDVKKILVDNENSTDILFYLTFSWMWLPTDRFRRVSTSLVSFTGDAVTVEGEITLSLIAEIDPQ